MESFQIIKNICFCFVACSIPSVMDSFALQHAKKSFAGRVITTVANSTHITYQAMLLKQFLIICRNFSRKRLPLLKGEDTTRPREYLFVAIDDFSRELYAGIYPDKTQYSAGAFLQQVLDECPYTIEYAYSDNGKEYKGTDIHAFVKLYPKSDIATWRRFDRSWNQRL